MVNTEAQANNRKAVETTNEYLTKLDSGIVRSATIIYREIAVNKMVARLPFDRFSFVTLSRLTPPTLKIRKT